MPQQTCPAVEDLTHLIAYHKEFTDQVEDVDLERNKQTIHALDWLRTFLLNRRNYQRKQQVKRQVMQRLITEHDLTHDLDENIAATYGEHLEKFDDNNENEGEGEENEA